MISRKEEWIILFTDWIAQKVSSGPVIDSRSTKLLAGQVFGKGSKDLNKFHEAHIAQGCRRWGPAERFAQVDTVQLVSAMIIREIGHRRQDGGLNVDAPVLSRLFQVISDGHLAYSQCRKIRDCPFPFPYSQLSILLLYLLAIMFPIFCVAYIKSWTVSPPSLLYSNPQMSPMPDLP